VRRKLAMQPRHAAPHLPSRVSLPSARQLWGLVGGAISLSALLSASSPLQKLAGQVRATGAAGLERNGASSARLLVCVNA
jgi:hypothetical protein